MYCEEFVAAKRAQIRAFDTWVWKDVLTNPGEYENYTLEDWEQLFTTFVENAE